MGRNAGLNVQRPEPFCNQSKPREQVPYEMWYGLPPLAGEVWPFLKPAIYRAQDGYYVEPSVNHPGDCMRVTHFIVLYGGLVVDSTTDSDRCTL